MARMLYDHEADPGENTNVATRPELAATVGALSGMLARRRQADRAWDEAHAPEAEPQPS